MILFMRSKRVSNESKIAKLFLKARYKSGKRHCPYCEDEKVYTLSGGKRFKCAKCRKPFRDWTNTPMQQFKLSEKSTYNLILAFIEGKSALESAQNENISYQTTFNFFKAIRKELSKKDEKLEEKNDDFKKFCEQEMSKYRGIGRKHSNLYKAEAKWRFNRLNSNPKKNCAQLLSYLLRAK